MYSTSTTRSSGCTSWADDFWGSRALLDRRADSVPRATLHYAIERLDPDERRHKRQLVSQPAHTGATGTDQEMP